MPEPAPDTAAYRVLAWADGHTDLISRDDVREVYVAADRAVRDLDNARGELRAVHAEKTRYRDERDQARNRLRAETDAARGLLQRNVELGTRADNAEAQRDDARAGLEQLRAELDEATRVVAEIGNAEDTVELYCAIGDLAQLFAARTTALAGEAS